MFTPDAAFGVKIRPDGRVEVVERVVWTGSRGDQVEVPAGTVSDGATRPWFTAALVNQWGPATRAFLVHDVLCERLRRDQEARRAWVAQEKANDDAIIRGREMVTVNPMPAETAVFDSVDSDGALRAIMRELGTPTVLRWFYWTAVRWAALFSSYRWGGWWRTLPALLLWTPVVLLVMAGPVLGALVGRGLLLVTEALVWPLTRVAPGRWRRGPRRRLRLGVQPIGMRQPNSVAGLREIIQRGLLIADQVHAEVDAQAATQVRGEHGPEFVLPRPGPGPRLVAATIAEHDGAQRWLYRWHPRAQQWTRTLVTGPDAKPVHAEGGEYRSWIETERADGKPHDHRGPLQKIARTAARCWDKACDVAGRVLDEIIDALVRIR